MADDEVFGRALFPAPGGAGVRGHGTAAPAVGRQLAAADGPGVWPGPHRPLPGLLHLPHHLLEEESHEVRGRLTLSHRLAIG